MTRLGLYCAAYVIAIMLNFGIATRTSDANAEIQQPQAAADLVRFRNYLEQINPGKKWRTGPMYMDSAEIRRAYEKTRFYFVYSSPPMPPGAPLPELLEEFERNKEAHQKEFISMSIGIDEQENITPLYKAVDYNQGLMPVRTDDDAGIAAAAILSLHISDHAGPEVVSAKEVTVTKINQGWSCSVFRENSFRGTVVFDNDGKCVSVTKVYIGPLPS